MIVFLAVVFFFNFSARFVWGPLLGEIEQTLGITHTVAGSLFLFITAGYFTGMLCSGYVSHRFSHGRTLSISGIGTGLMLLALAATHHLTVIKIWLVILGVFSGFHLPSAVASVVHRLDIQDLGKGFSIHELGPSLGYVLCPLIAQGIIYATGSWRFVPVFIGVCMVVLGIGYGFGDRLCTDHGESPTLKNMGVLFVMPVFWEMLLLFSLGLSAAVGVYTMLSLYLQVERGMSSASANMIVSISRVVAVLAPLTAGQLCARYDHRRLSAFFIGGAGLLTLLIPLVPDRLIWAPLVVQPFLVGAFFVPGYALLAKAAPAGYYNLIIALIAPLAMVFGGGVTPVLIGVLADAHQFNTAFLLLGGLVAAGALILFRPSSD